LVEEPMPDARTQARQLSNPNPREEIGRRAYVTAALRW
jgi:hypothetical protein